MKKALITLLSAVMLLSITACSSSEGNGGGKEEPVTAPLADIMDAVLEGTDDEIAVDNADISPDRFSWFFGGGCYRGDGGIFFRGYDRVHCPLRSPCCACRTERTPPNWPRKLKTLWT